MTLSFYKGLENQSLWQRLNFCKIFKIYIVNFSHTYLYLEVIQKSCVFNPRDESSEITDEQSSLKSF